MSSRRAARSRRPSPARGGSARTARATGFAGVRRPPFLRALPRPAPRGGRPSSRGSLSPGITRSRVDRRQQVRHDSGNRAFGRKPSSRTAAGVREARQAAKPDLRRLPHAAGSRLPLLFLDRDRRRRPDRADVARRDVERVLARAPVDVRLEAVVAEVPGAAARAEAVARIRERPGEPDRRRRRVGAVAAERLGDPPAQYASSSASSPSTPAQSTATSSPCARAAAATASRLSSEPT